jgi:hypothetical protein
MPATTKHEGRPFRPTSLEDFSRYARNLSWLIQEPYQKTQELLARAYGYSGLHELRKALQQPALEEDDQDTHPLVRQAKINLDGTMRLQDILRQYRESQGRQLTSRDIAAFHIGLFSSPPIHREYFAREKQKIIVLEGQESHGDNLTVFDYADIDIREDGETFLAFTELGQSIYDAVSSYLPDPYTATEEQIDRFEDSIGLLRERHPNNPWPIAMHISALAPILWQGDWTFGWNSEQTPYDAPDGYVKFAPGFASEVLPDIKRAISLFEQLYGSHSEKAPDPKLISGQYKYGTDTHYWPATLYWGGVIAFTAGDEANAYRWLSKCHKLDSTGSFGTRYYLAMLRLNRGKGSVRSLFPRLSSGEPYHTVVSRLARAAEAYIKQKHNLAKQHFADALGCSWAASEPFAGRDRQLAALHVNSNIDTPAEVQEFMHRTKPFWSRHKDAGAFFTKLATNPDVKKALRTLYLREAELPDAWSGMDGTRSRERFYFGGENTLLRDAIKDAVARVAIG